MTRIRSSSSEVIDRSQVISFTWNGKKLQGFAGDTITSALLANGQGITARSMKYHRPRGPLTADFWDPNTTMQVDDEPNVRASHRLLEDGMNVAAQNVWPSLKYDVKAANGLVGRFLSAGFYYKTFMRPAALWPRYEAILATFAPGGSVDLTTPHGYHDKRYAHPDVVVAGGGPAGMAAAIAAAEAGADVILVEHEYALGGHLLWGTDADRVAAADLAAQVAAAGVEILVNSTVTGRYEDNWVAILQRSHPTAVERLIKARAKSLIVAAGTIERPYVFAGNDLPGVMTSGAVRRLITMYGVAPGTRAVVFTANESGDAAVEDLRRAGVDVARVVDARKGERITEAKGTRRVIRKVLLANNTAVACDLLVTAVGWTAPTSLLNMAGDRPVYDPSAARFFPAAPPDNVLATGGIAGDGTIDELIAHGQATGQLAAARAAAVRYAIQAATARAAAVDPTEPAPTFPEDTRTALPRAPHEELFRADTHGIVDYSEDVSSKDLFGAAAEGFDSVELIKRFTTATMGPSQGKLETVNTVAILAEARGETIAEVGTTVWRPPYAPVTLGALGGRVFEPVRVSSIQPWHEANNFTPILAGQWVRPDHYGDPEAEVRNTRTNVGITDVTPLGKLDLQGPDVAPLLSQIYTNKWMQLPVGSVRYGMMCAEDGVVLDDGVTGRLADDHYLMTTTSSGAGTVWNWVESWLQTEHPEWQVHVTPVTTGYTSINVAGPKSRELMQRITTDLDLSPEAFGYMQVRTGTIAGVDDCIVWRIGFTGELSFEVHVPSQHGLDVWETLLSEGTDLGVAAFGLEAQRIMRLEKGHFIVGQDTDGLSKAPTTGMIPLLKIDKDDFAGKPEITWSLEGTYPLIVAVQPTDPSAVPEEACQILRAGTNEIVGRITSSRFSPTLERSICLAQVTQEFAPAGTELTILRVSGERITGRVMEHQAHFDPEGERLRG
ncbi:MAG: sarcosine oxidase subunit alpha [Candidatus Aldehydirespiratoraceae bacterium]|jgi:sarcosine oxidase subunit alpha